MIKWINLFLVGIVISFAACSDKDDPNAQLNKEINAIDKSLLNTLDYIVYDQNGSRIAIEEFGDGPPPHTGQTVVFQYTAELFPEGDIFDGGMVTSKLDDVQPLGLKRSLSALLKGTHADLYIPSSYAYGSKGNDMVPPNKTILYRLHLIDVIRTGTEQVQYEKDTAAIHTYIKTKNIQNVYMDASGMWYSLEAEGPGKTPRPYDLVSFSYKGSLMSNGSIFDQGSVVSQNIFSLIDGLKFGIPHTNEGSSVTFYIPSGLAYGPNGSSPGIPGNANVIFEIKLNTVDN